MKYLIVSLLFVSQISLAKGELPNGAIKQDVSIDLQTYVDAFIASTKDHDRDKVMNLLHPDYVKQQHDEFLEGRTEQFLDELYFPKLFREVKKIQFVAYYKWRDVYWVRFILKGKGGKETKDWGIAKRDDGSSFKFGIWGAVG